MGYWMKVSTGLFQNHRVIKAGLEATAVYLQLLALNGTGRQDGVLEQGKCEPAYLAVLLGGLGLDADVIKTSLERCVSVGLLDYDREAGTYSIHGWDDTWKPPMTDAERARKMRDRRRVKLKVEEPGHSEESDKRDAQRDTKEKETVTKTSRLGSKSSRLEREREREIGRQERGPSKPLSLPPLKAADEPARPRAPTGSGRQALADREQALPDEGRAILAVLDEKELIPPKTRKRAEVRLTLAEDAIAAGLTTPALIAALNGLAESSSGSPWRPEAFRQLQNPGRLRAWAETWTRTQDARSRIDHHFGTEGERICREDAQSGSESFERLIASRYSNLIRFAERAQSGAIWSISMVPAPYRIWLDENGHVRDEPKPIGSK